MMLLDAGSYGFCTRVKDPLRFIPAHTISATLGSQMCKALPAFHSLTGCNSTRGFSGVGKKAWKGIISNTTYQESLASVGRSFDHDVDTAKEVKAFVCSLYNVMNRTPATADELPTTPKQHTATFNFRQPSAAHQKGELSSVHREKWSGAKTRSTLAWQVEDN